MINIHESMGPDKDRTREFIVRRSEKEVISRSIPFE